MRSWARPLILLTFALLAACGSSGREEEDDLIETSQEPLRACADGPTLEGIDVSHYQGNIDWGAVARSGKVFAISKATEGTRYVDPMFAANWAGARTAGLVRGAYHYFHPGSDPVAQAEHFARTMGPLAPGDLPPMLDLEETDGLGPSAVERATRRFLERLEALTGRRPLIYTGFYFWRDQVGDPAGYAQYPLVMAAYTSRCPLVPDSFGRFAMWQYTSSGVVPGIRGRVDLDVFNGDRAALDALTGGIPPPPAAPPTPPAGCGALVVGQGLAPGQAVASCDHRSTLVHQADGNLVLYRDGPARWSSGTDGRRSERLVMQGDGNLVLYAAGGRALWSTGTDGRGGTFLAVQDDGNVVLYAARGQPLWATNTVDRAAAPPPPPPPPPAPMSCGRAGPDTILGAGAAVSSCSGRFVFVHQGDGNVVLYDAGTARWSTRTAGRSTQSLVMQGDGNLVLYAPNGRALWSTRTEGHAGAWFAVQDDGNVVIYDARDRPLWATNTAR